MQCRVEYGLDALIGRSREESEVTGAYNAVLHPARMTLCKGIVLRIPHVCLQDWYRLDCILGAEHSLSSSSLHVGLHAPRFMPFCSGTMTPACHGELCKHCIIRFFSYCCAFAWRQPAG